MPQIVKGGKYVFGWSRVGTGGEIVVPGEALDEYNFKESQRLILVPGSRTSGGFGLGTVEAFKGSPVGRLLETHPELANHSANEGAVVEASGKAFCWVNLCGGSITAPLETLERHGVAAGDKLLVVRGSGLAIGFIVRGPIVGEAERHAELEMFEPRTAVGE
jgi:bifunctional DNA-binding transcriptional regulator/antitoxin component of YhaV-PrlF toxin-antitoxin module